MKRIMLTIIPEFHDAIHEKFSKDAQQIANSGKILLLLENYVFEKYKDGKISEGVYAIEDFQVFLYVQILETINKYFLLKVKNMAKNNNQFMSALEVYLNPSSYKNRIVENIISDFLNDIDTLLLSGSYFDNGPNFSDYLIDELDNNEHDFNTFIFSNNRIINETTVRLLLKNIERIKYALSKFGNKVRELILENKSDRVKGYECLKVDWLDRVLSFNENIYTGSLDRDAAIIDLRNQIFAERISTFADNSQSNLWFIVGNAHVKGLTQLLKQQYPHIRFQAISMEEKANVYSNSPHVLLKINKYPYRLFFNNFNRNEEDVSCEELAKSVFGQSSNTAKAIKKR